MPDLTRQEFEHLYAIRSGLGNLQQIVNQAYKEVDKAIDNKYNIELYVTIGGELAKVKDALAQIFTTDQKHIATAQLDIDN